MWHWYDILEHKDITEAIIGSAFEVYNVLGYGLLEKVYQKALQAEFMWFVYWYISVPSVLQGDNIVFF